MDVSSFMTGYFVGLVAGAGAFILWTYAFGRFLPKEWPFGWRKIANAVARLRGKQKPSVEFVTRREINITPAE